MDYENLRRIQRAERDKPELSHLDEGFYKDMFASTREARAKYKESGSIEDLKRFENLLKSARDIFERREQKIIMKVVRAAHTGDTVAESKLAGDEKALFESVFELMKKNKLEFEAELAGEAEKRPTEEAKAIQNIKDIPAMSNGSEEKKGEDLNTVLVRIIKKVPRFVAGDMAEWGPFETNEIVRLPKKEAELLSNRSFVEII
jgi:DNA replication initiation complex subunit (GINS family)